MNSEPVKNARRRCPKFYPVAIGVLAIWIALLGGDDGGPRSGAVGGAKRSVSAGPAFSCRWRRHRGTAVYSAPRVDWTVCTCASAAVAGVAAGADGPETRLNRPRELGAIGSRSYSGRSGGG